MKNRPRAFTLVEMLIVIGALALLTALLLPALRRPLQQKAIVEATVTLESMAAALTQLKEDCRYDGVLAQNADGGLRAEYIETNEFVKELAPKLPAWADTYTPLLNTKKTNYMEFKQHSIRGAAVADPWGNPYKYAVRNKNHNDVWYDVELIYSDGPDRRPATEDDIVRVVHEYPAAGPHQAKSR